MENQQTPNFYAVVIAPVRYCHELEFGARLLYGEITALCSREGYCWASNEYFAKCYQVDVRTIQNWLESLKSKEFIRIELDKSNFKTKRKIWIIDRIQINPTKRKDFHVRDEENFTSDMKESSPIVLHPPNNTSLKEDINIPPDTKECQEEGAARPCPDLRSGRSNKPLKKDKKDKEASDQAKQLAKALLNSVRQVKSDFIPQNPKKWSAEIDKMLNLDKRNPENILKVIQWIPTNDFWKANVLCPESLRKQFDRLELAMAGNKEEEWLKQNKATLAEWQRDNPDELKHLYVKGNYVINKENSKEVHLKMQPQAFQNVLMEVAGLKYA